MFSSSADFELRVAGRELALCWPRPVALLAGEFAATGEPRHLVDAVERVIDHLLCAELAAAPVAVRKRVLEEKAKPPLMWGRKLKMLEAFLESRTPPLFDIWDDAPLWAPMRTALKDVEGWFTRGRSACLAALWPVVQVRNDHIHRRGLHDLDPSVLLGTLRALDEAMTRAVLIYVQACDPTSDRNYRLEYLNYNSGSALPAPRQERVSRPLKGGWSMRVESVDGTRFFDAPWVSQSSTRAATWRFDYEIDFAKNSRE